MSRGGEKEVSYETDEDLSDDVSVDDLEDEQQAAKRGGGKNLKRRRSNRENDDHRRSRFLDDEAEESDAEEDDEEDDEIEDGFINDGDDEDGENLGKRRGGQKRKRRREEAEKLFDLECDETDADSSEDENQEIEPGFIDDDVNPNDGDDDRPRVNRRPLLSQDEDVGAFLKGMEERFSKVGDESDCDDEFIEVDEIDQQSLLPCVRDPKLWLVKCAIGHERELALCLMQKYFDRKPHESLMIKSAIALDNLKNYIYVEAEKEVHVREACKGLRFAFAHQKIVLVPIKEMTSVVSVECKAVGVQPDSWVRMKIKDYAGDIAKVVDVDDVRRKVRVKLIPRIDWEALARKLNGLEWKKKAFRVAPRLMNVDEVGALGIRVERRREQATGDYFDRIGEMLFRDGFLYKTVSMRSIRWDDITPTLDELEKFGETINGGDGDGRKKGGFIKGDAVVVVKGDLQNLVGRVEKVEGDGVHIRPEMKGLPENLVIHKNELCKSFKVGSHVKVVSGIQKGATGMVVDFEQKSGLMTIFSLRTKQHVSVFADDVVEGCFDANVDDANGGLSSLRLDTSRTPKRFFPRGGSRRDANGGGLAAGTRVKIRLGPYKGYRGRVVEVKGTSLRVELESPMKIVIVDRGSCISDSDGVKTPYRGGSETPMHPSTPMYYPSTPLLHPSTPLHPYYDYSSA